MYKVRKANKDDSQWIIEVAAKRMVEDEYQRPELYNKSTMEALLNSCLDNGLVLLAEKDGERGGVIIGIVTNHPFNNEIKVLTELVWYILPEYRKSRMSVMLLDSYTKEAKGLADEATFSLLPTSNIKEESMQKRGYELMENGYLMRT